MSQPKEYFGERYNFRNTALTWHPDFRAGRIYRCTCMSFFRLPGGRIGPNGALLKRKGAREMKRKTRWDIPIHTARG